MNVRLHTHFTLELNEELFHWILKLVILTYVVNGPALYIVLDLREC